MQVLKRRLIKCTVFVAASLPLLVLARGVFFGALAADPYPPSIQATGLWAMRLLLLGLTLTPLSRATGWAWPIEIRRMVGLFAAFYALLHLLIWMKDYDFDWAFILGETVGRAYLAIGLVAVLLLVPLAATSMDAAVRWLGARGWRKLHWLVFPAVALGYLHFEMAGRFTRAETLLDALLLVALFGWRLLRWARRMLRLRAQYP
ncbi:MAG TPA: ferric reductase-like transmembrane domain-containing protein [Stellaceae bacterium]|nr:ferric reductase-like transmembrane domain-containing protein [Stellaceae bacterium]